MQFYIVWEYFEEHTLTSHKCFCNSRDSQQSPDVSSDLGSSLLSSARIRNYKSSPACTISFRLESETQDHATPDAEPLI
jgi:hypothetical protein